MRKRLTNNGRRRIDWKSKVDLWKMKIIGRDTKVLEFEFCRFIWHGGRTRVSRLRYTVQYQNGGKQ